MEEAKHKKSDSRRNGSKLKIKKPVVSLGLSNLGNTGYANAVIQALIHTNEFYDIMNSLNSKQMCRMSPTDDFGSIGYVYQILRKGFTSQEDFIRAEEILDIIKNVCGSQMVIGHQQDAHEFFLLLLDNLVQTWHNKSPKQKSRKTGEYPDGNDMSYLFKGALVSTISCKNCFSEYDSIQAFTELKLEHNRDILAEEVLDGNNQYNCSQGNCLSDAVKTSKIQIAPPVLIISLGRFNHLGMKLREKIPYPETLDLTHKAYVKKKVKLIYELHAVIVHEGRFSFKGHYFTYVKGYDKKWYKCDDQFVTEIKDEDEILSASPYICFYRMKPSSRKYYMQKQACEHTADFEPEDKSPKVSKSKNNCNKKPQRRSTRYMKTMIKLPYGYSNQS